MFGQRNTSPMPSRLLRQNDMKTRKLMTKSHHQWFSSEFLSGTVEGAFEFQSLLE